jgi:hypothetical protein
VKTYQSDGAAEIWPGKDKTGPSTTETDKAGFTG